MPKHRFHLIFHASCALALCGVLAVGAAAQHTSVEKNGFGGRIETDYNAAGKATEMRTIGPNGKLQQRVDYEYLAGYYGAQQTDTTYSTNGRVQKIVRHTYDPSTNFTGEYVRAFDDSGKQAGGHKLTHDPWTGIYHCSEWTLSTHSYRTVACPSGEEESGGVKQVPHTFTYDEVMRNLEAARKAAREGQAPSAALTHKPAVAPAWEMGLILPAHLRSGERVSGTIVDDPDDYEGIPGVTVTRIKLPLNSEEVPQFEINGEKLQPASSKVSFVVPSQSIQLSVVPWQTNSGDAVSKVLPIRRASKETESAHSTFQAVPLCLKAQLCIVEGPFSGDSSKTFLSFDEHPATIVAETSRAAYVRIPEATAPGPRTLFLADGSKLAALPLIVGQLAIEGNGRELKAGNTLIASITLSGPSDLPETAWEGDRFPDTALQTARQLIPGFQPRKENRASGSEKENHHEEEGESSEKREGKVLLILKNAAPHSFSLRASTNHMLIFRLADHSFERGDFTYSLLLEAKQAGKVDVKGYVVSLLAPVTAQEFQAK